MAQELEDALDTRVRVTYSGGKTLGQGTIAIDFAGGEDLQRLVKQIAGSDTN